MACAPRKKPPSFKMEIPGDVTCKMMIREKIDIVRETLHKMLGKPVNQADILLTVLDSWIKDHHGRRQAPTVPEQQVIKKNQADEAVFLTSKSSINKLIELVQDHHATCTSPLSMSKVKCSGHVMFGKLSCRRLGSAKHSRWWTSSPKFPSGRLLVNERVQHGLACSGMLPVTYERFVRGVGMGCIQPSIRSTYWKDTFSPHVKEEYLDSIETALLEEVASSIIEQENEEESEWQGIDIGSDARHGWRKNAKDTSVDVIGDQSHKVLQHVHVTKSDDPVTQRHEKLGTSEFYKYMDKQAVPVRTHTHDRNLAVNKSVKDMKTINNQNDVWHSIKALKKAIFEIGHGAKKREGHTWHRQLEDKAESVGTHAYWAIKHCNEDGDQLRELLLNAVCHYKHDHTKCHRSSRCQPDLNYESQRIVITSPVAEDMLRRAITKSTIYRSADDFIYGKGTFYVESFNNTMNMFQDKRIVFGDEQYLCRSHLAVLHWNENVNRSYTSVWKKTSGKVKKNYKKSTYHYRKRLWTRLVNSQY